MGSHIVKREMMPGDFCDKCQVSGHCTKQQKKIYRCRTEDQRTSQAGRVLARHDLVGRLWMMLAAIYIGMTAFGIWFWFVALPMIRGGGAF
jgi:hypothetical protein